MRYLWWMVAALLMVLASAWAWYVVSFYPFLAGFSPQHELREHGAISPLADVQGYVVAFGLLALVVAVLIGCWALKHSSGRYGQIDHRSL